MSTFTKQKTAEPAVEEDYVGTGTLKFGTEIGEVVITEFYLGEFGTGSKYVQVSLRENVEEGAAAKFHSERILYETADGRMTYTRDGKEYYFKGVNTLNAICVLACGEEMFDLDEPVEMEAKAWVDGSLEDVTVEGFEQIVGEVISVGILLAENAHYQTGAINEYPEIDKVFQAGTMLTISEGYAEKEEGTHYLKWLKSHPEGYVKPLKKEERLAAEKLQAAQGENGAPKNTSKQQKPKNPFKK